MPGRIMRRVRQRANQRGALNRPDLSRYKHLPPDPPAAPPPPLFDAEMIVEEHPTWWQVHRVEDRNGDRRAVLIGEFADETQAFLFVATQRSQCRIRKWGSRERPYFSMRDPLLVP
jgi:hypothetical protein